VAGRASFRGLVGISGVEFGGSSIYLLCPSALILICQPSLVTSASPLRCSPSAGFRGVLPWIHDYHVGLRGDGIDNCRGLGWRGHD
jgi:hypothetical protein